MKPVGMARSWTLDSCFSGLCPLGQEILHRNVVSGEGDKKTIRL